MANKMPRQPKRADESDTENVKTPKASGPKRVSEEVVNLDTCTKVHAEDLADREVRGALLAQDVLDGSARRHVINEEHVMYVGKKNTVYDVKWKPENRRGKLIRAYTCGCSDFQKEGRNGCMHIIAERIFVKTFEVVGDISQRRAKEAKARRRPLRSRKAADGRALRTAHSAARVGFADELPRLITSLGKAWERENANNQTKDDFENVVVLRGRRPTANVMRAMALLYKISYGKSAEAMQADYHYLIDNGNLRMHHPPHANSLTNWMNDYELTPILRAFIPMTAFPFRRREIGAMLDSSKVSQMRTAHARRVQYEGDLRPGADWMRCHALVGVETMVCMAVDFAGVSGLGTHDSNFIQPLVTEAIKQFRLEYLLADKAYFGQKNTNWLWNEAQMRAVIPVKKKTEAKPGLTYFDPFYDLIEWYDKRQVDFHEIYRLRTKIEAFFSVMKRMTQESMWSRGRHVSDEAGKVSFDPMRNGPCVAWVNEALCKFIYMNLRMTALLQEETGISIDYLTPERCFPPPSEPLIKSRAA